MAEWCDKICDSGGPAGQWRARNVSREPMPYVRGDDNQMQWKREITVDGTLDYFKYRLKCIYEDKIVFCSVLLRSSHQQLFLTIIH